MATAWTKELTLFLPAETRQRLENRYSWQIAFRVATEKAPAQSNLVWRTFALDKSDKRSDKLFTWSHEYAINWTSGFDPQGRVVSVGGEWQQCEMGKVYDIDANGQFNESTKAGLDGWLGVGENNHKDGVFILIGMRKGRKWEPFYIDRYRLALGPSSRRYQPQDAIEWFFHMANMEGLPIGIAAGEPIGVLDTSKPNSITGTSTWWTTYDLRSRVWHIEEEQPEGTYGYSPYKREFYRKRAAEKARGSSEEISDA